MIAAPGPEDRSLTSAVYLTKPTGVPSHDGPQYGTPALISCRKEPAVNSRYKFFGDEIDHETILVVKVEIKQGDIIHDPGQGEDETDISQGRRVEVTRPVHGHDGRIRYWVIGI